MKPITLIACIALGGAVAIPAGLYLYEKAREATTMYEVDAKVESYQSAMKRMIDGDRVISINCGSTVYVDVRDDSPGFSEAGLDVIREGCGDRATVSAIIVQTSKGNVVQKWP